MNIVILTGNIGKNPEERTFDSGAYKVEFPLATNKWMKDGDDYKQKTTWHNIVLWGSRAQGAIKSLQKGDLVQIVGEIETRSWEQDGEKKYRTEISASRFERLNKRENSEPSPVGEKDISDDLPF